MKRYALILFVACAALLLPSFHRSAAQTPAAPGPPASGLVTGASAVRKDDAVAALRMILGLTDPTPAQVSALDVDSNGDLSLGDVTLVLRAALGDFTLPMPPAMGATPPMSFPLQSGWYDGKKIQFISTDDSDPAGAAAMNVNLAPALAGLAGTDAVDPLFRLFYSDAAGKLTPVPGQLPVFGSAPKEDDYSPIWQVMQVIVTPNYQANTLTRDDDITNDKGPAAGGFVTKITPTNELFDCPVLFRQDIDDLSVPHPYATASATFSADSTKATLPTMPALYDGDTFLIVAPDTASMDDQKMDHNNLATALSAAGMKAIPLYEIMGANGSMAQPLVLSAAPDPLGPTSTKTDYTPVWMSTPVQWTGALAANPPMLMSDDDVKSHLASGDLRALPGAFVFNCPVVAKPAATTPPPPAPMTIAMTNFTFSPKQITVPVGTTITWTNQDQAAHTTTSGQAGTPDGIWDSGTLGAGKSFSFTFTKAGTFPYYCQFHFGMGMVGQVTVTPAASPTPPAPAAMAVAMTNFTFSPKQIAVPVGTTITWTNQDAASHTATSGSNATPDNLFGSGTVKTGQSFSFTFTKAGVFPYYCKFHVQMGMVGQVTVK